TAASGPFVEADDITIQGDPNYEPSSLTAYSLASVHRITLVHMHLDTVSFASCLISHCLIGRMVEVGGTNLSTAQNWIIHNYFDSGFVSLGGDNAHARIIDNVFHNGGVSSYTNGDTIIRGNQFIADQSFDNIPIYVVDYGDANSPDVIEDNQF